MPPTSKRPDAPSPLAVRGEHAAWARPRNLAFLGVFFLVAAPILGAVVHSSAIVDGDGRVLEELIEHRTDRLTVWMMFITNAFSPLGAIVVSLGVGGLLWWRTRSWVRGLYVPVSVGVAALVTYLLKLVFERSRPPLVDHLVNEVDFSFPSGHTTGAASLACAACLVLTATYARTWSKALAWAVGAVLIATVAVSRLYLGVHWFTDTLGGALVGIGTALVLFALMRGPLVPVLGRIDSGGARM
ncbi:phosphatase PAP2 family protein [Falsarthrobacter nasiphocae]|uniref:Undecaprenyl-diphosphatase n=1 Tax=Falsarthrobacter nasiphocae TaxID=189863 RepID=A0AAE3YEF7_9MICC|nr:phosphatase PAP2 family protein [Falsarthrobacter nasiphocae]MDR6891212.1 undecaprenyl-diphosphatase [Falsarthrobacter nasiphocae]